MLKAVGYNLIFKVREPSEKSTLSKAVGYEFDLFATAPTQNLKGLCPRAL